MNNQDNNPLLDFNGLPAFDKIKPEHVVPAVREVITGARLSLEKLEKEITPTWEGLLEPLEAMEIPFEYAWGPVSHLMGVKNSDELRTAHDTVLPELVTFDLSLHQSKPIFNALNELKNSGIWNTLEEGQQRVIDNKILAAELAGVGLSGEKRTRFNEIQQELSKLSTDFSNHVLDATKTFELIIDNRDDTSGWPESLRKLSSQSYNQAKDTQESTPQEGPWRITLDYPSFVPFMQHSRNRDQREELYRAFVTRASAGDLDNTPLIDRILELRKEKASILGFDSYADLSLATKMAPDVKAVDRMCEELGKAALPFSKKEFASLEEIARDSGQADPLVHWDIAFWSERLREKLFDYTDDDLRPYFPLPVVLEGLFSLCRRLFGVEVKENSSGVSVWHKDVRFFDVIEDGTHIASFYLDPYSRPHEKRGGAWMDECLGRRIINAETRIPVAYICCNSAPPIGQTPSLMNFNEVTTLFHEFGHALQGMLTKTNFADVAGINGVEWDAVEMASQFMENWCYEHKTLDSISSHVDTGEHLPENLADKIRRAKTFRAGAQMMRQLEFAITDLRLHHDFDPKGKTSPDELHKQIASKTSVLGPFSDDHFLCSFSHIFAGGYAAGYYSYKWAEVLSADLFSAFEETGFDNDPEIENLGRRYRNTVLALGGSRHPMDVFRDFMGREPSTKALLRQNDLLKN